MALLSTPEAEFGQPAPEFKLPATDGKTYSKSDFFFGKPTLIMFICNHCPYVLAIEDRLIQLGADLKNKGIPVAAISSNDAVTYPADSFEKMQERAQEKNYSFVYMHDDSQAVAKDFGAVCTPDFFLYDQSGKLAYRGRLDDSWKDPSLVSKQELYEAAIKLAKGEPLSEKQTPSMGCSLKWKTNHV